MDLGCARDGLYPLSVEEKYVSGHPRIPQRDSERSPKVARELPSQKTVTFVLDLLLKQCLFEQGRKYEKKAPDMICSWTQRALAMGFSLCLSKKRPSHGPSVRLRWAFPPACPGKGHLMDLVCACDGLSPCLSRKRQYHGLGVRL